VPVSSDECAAIKASKAAAARGEVISREEHRARNAARLAALKG
jgi:hypothetical protein